MFRMNALSSYRIVAAPGRSARETPASQRRRSPALPDVPTSAESALAEKVGDKIGNMEKVVQAIPLDRIVLETDSPYLTPVPHRGKRNEPGYVRFVAEHVAKLKSVGIDEVSDRTTQNARQLFNLV